MSLFQSVILSLAVFVLAHTAEAFTGISAPLARTTTKLGPVARNGLGYEEVEIGTGRNVFPGDTVVCYYSGQYKTVSLMGEKKVTFDETLPGEPAEFVSGDPLANPVGLAWRGENLLGGPGSRCRFRSNPGRNTDAAETAAQAVGAVGAFGVVAGASSPSHFVLPKPIVIDRTVLNLDHERFHSHAIMGVLFRVPNTSTP